MYRLILLLSAILMTASLIVGESTEALANAETTPVTKESVTKWKEVRYDGKVTYIPNDATKRCPQWEPKLKKHGLPLPLFSYIMWRESRCRPTAINARFDKRGRTTWTLNRNGTYDSGLLQINSSWVTLTSRVCKSKMGDMKVLQKPECNLKVAKVILEDGGIRNWGF